MITTGAWKIRAERHAALVQTLLVGCTLVLSGCGSGVRRRAAPTATAARPAPAYSTAPSWAQVGMLPTDWTQRQRPFQVRPHLWLLQKRAFEVKPNAASAVTRERGKACFDGMWLTGNGRNDLEALGVRCGQREGLRPFSGQVSGQQERKGKADTYIMRWKAGKCYRVIAVADASIVDLDAAIADESGKVIASDKFSDAAPLLPTGGTYCPLMTGAYVLVISVQDGAGDYWFQVWTGSPVPLQLTGSRPKRGEGDKSNGNRRTFLHAKHTSR